MFVGKPCIPIRFSQETRYIKLLFSFRYFDYTKTLKIEQREKNENILRKPGKSNAYFRMKIGKGINKSQQLYYFTFKFEEWGKSFRLLYIWRRVCIEVC